MAAQLFHFAEGAQPATRLAHDLEYGAAEVEVHHFPDGESRVRVEAAAPVAILYRSLDHPNGRLIELLLAAAALRDNGAQRVVLVVPYLAYMRQDIAFRPGEAISQRVIGALLATHFDGVITVDPHLHRIRSLTQIMPGIPTQVVSAGRLLAQAIDTADRPLLVGPDSESRQWVAQIAQTAGLEFAIGEKRRDGDRTVAIAFPDIDRVAGQRVVLVDDVIASGETLAQSAGLLRAAGASRIDAIATHCLAGPADLARLNAAGIATIRATDTVAGPMADIPIAPLLAQAIRNFPLTASEAP